MSCYLAAWAIERDAGRIARDHPALWREVRRFNLPVKLALAAAQRVLGALADPRRARLISLAPCRPGSPELRAASHDADASLAHGAGRDVRVNPIHALHAIDNLALSLLSLRLENREPCACLGGAAGQAWLALEQAQGELAAGSAAEVLVLGGDQGEASWRGEPADPEIGGVALVLTPRPGRVRLVAIESPGSAGARSNAKHCGGSIESPGSAGERSNAKHCGGSIESPGSAGARSNAKRCGGSIESPGSAGGGPRPHAARGLVRWLDALAAAPAGRMAYRVPAEDGDGVDELTVIAELA